MDEAEVAKQKYISVLVGSLDAPNQTFFVRLEYSRHSKSDTREIFLLILADAARYMSSTGKTLKELHPSLMHVTCVAHFQHNCAMRVRAHFKNIDQVIATIKAATIKNKDRKKDFHDAGLPFPPDPVLQDGQLGLELPYIIVRTFQLFVPLSTIGQVQAS